MTTTTVNAAGSERMFRAATVLAMLIAVAALTVALLNRPGVIARTGAVSVTPVPATRVTSMSGLVPGGSVYKNQVPPFTTTQTPVNNHSRAASDKFWHEHGTLD